MANGRKLTIHKEKDSNGEIIFTYKKPVGNSPKTQIHDVSKKNYKKSKVHSIIQKILKRFNIEAVHIPFKSILSSKNKRRQTIHNIQTTDNHTLNTHNLDKQNEANRQYSTDIMTLTESQILVLLNDASLINPFREASYSIADNIGYHNMVKKIFGANRTNMSSVKKTDFSYEKNFRRKHSIHHKDVNNGQLAKSLFFLSIKVELAKEMKIGNKALKRKHYNVIKMGPL